MALGTCIPDLVAQGLVPEDRAKALTELYERYVREYEPQMGRAAAEAQATVDALKYMEVKAAEKNRVALLQMRAQRDIDVKARTKFEGADASKKPNPDAYAAVLATDSYGRAQYMNAETKHKIRRNEAHMLMTDLLYEHRANALGEVRNKADFDEVVDVLEGKQTNNVNVREMADSVAKVLEFIRQGLNAAGAHIDKMVGGYFPHRWDSLKVALTSYTDWRKDVLLDLDRAKMIDRETGLRMSDEKLELLLNDIYQNLATDGEIGYVGGSGQGRGAVYNRRSAQRILHFKPGGWTRINDKYGAGSAYEQLIWHIDDATLDMALMEEMGPNPKATAKWMQNQIKNNAFTGNSLWSRFRVARGQRSIERLYEELTGENRRVVNRNVALAGSTIRSLQTSTKLGSALLSSMSDAGTSQLTRNFNGLSKDIAFDQMFSHLNPLDNSHRDAVRRHIYIQEEFIGQSAGYGRIHMEDFFGGAVIAPTLDKVRSGDVSMREYASLKLTEKLQSANEWARRLSELQMRASLLNQWTTNQRSATISEFFSNVTHHRASAFDDTPPKWQRFLQRYGIGPEGWDQIRQSPPQAFGETGIDMIVPSSIKNKDLRDALMGAVLTELDYAVPTGGVRQRAALHTFGQPGELWGYEVPKFLGQFLLFPITVGWKHAARAWAQPSASTKAGYAIAFLATMTLYGGISEQLQNLRKGKDLRPMDNWDFWQRAMMRGGGLGYPGEVLEHATSEDGRGLDSLLSAPGISTIANVSNATVRPAYRFATGEEDTGFKRGLYTLAEKEVPLLNTWYLNTAYQRLIVDRIGEWADEEYMADKYQRMEKRAAEEGTQFYAPPGSGLTGMRAPDFANAFAEVQE